MIASREYAEAMEGRSRMLGQSVGAAHGEAYALDRPPGIADPLRALFGLAPGPATPRRPA
ncbi:MAG: hypothetical protein BWZ10_02432 [candidate division BRC1 bacterium ADurb.BinA364]|nr:MAG: hypothetical protein BWZ10_02432 [candidate division BRC1 bacterium ADurb.BinA364]